MKLRIRLILVLAVLLLNQQLVPAQEAVLEATLRGQTVRATVEFITDRSEEVLASLWDGLKAEIIFEVRLYKRSREVFSFLGDRPLAEIKITQTANFDFYENRYKILRDGDKLGEYAAEAEFLRAFFLLDDCMLGEVQAVDREDYYVVARARMMPVKIITPLNIITLFSSDTTIRSPWVEAEIR
jgi:hypothetical protein